jgi:hypothetical protein
MKTEKPSPRSRSSRDEWKLGQSAGRGSIAPQAHQSKDPDILAADVALRRAARRAREIGRKTGTPVYVLKNGRIVDLTKEWKRRARSR